LLRQSETAWQQESEAKRDPKSGTHSQIIGLKGNVLLVQQSTGKH
jgi:hypothetical protein